MDYSWLQKLLACAGKLNFSTSVVPPKESQVVSVQRINTDLQKCLLDVSGHTHSPLSEPKKHSGY
jgi:hypothetical protein